MVTTKHFDNVADGHYSRSRGAEVDDPREEGRDRVNVRYAERGSDMMAR